MSSAAGEEDVFVTSSASATSGAVTTSTQDQHEANEDDGEGASSPSSRHSSTTSSTDTLPSDAEEEEPETTTERKRTKEHRDSIRKALITAENQPVYSTVKASAESSSILSSLEPKLQYLSDRLVDVQENQKMLNYTLLEEWEALGGPYRQKVDYGKMILSMLKRPTSKSTQMGGAAADTSTQAQEGTTDKEPAGHEQETTDTTQKIPDHPTARRLSELKQVFSQIPHYESKLQNIRRKAAQIDTMVAKKRSEAQKLKEVTQQRVTEEYHRKKQDEELDQQLAAAVIDRSQREET